MYNLYLIIIILHLTACSSVPFLQPQKLEITQGNILEQSALDALTIGMSKIEVKNLMGTAMLQSNFHKNRWDYIYYLKQDAKPLEKQHLVLFFEGSKLTEKVFK